MIVRAELENDRAKSLAESLGTMDLDLIVEQHDLRVWETLKWDEGPRNIFISPVIFLPSDIAPNDKRSLIAHCIGHHLLHPNDRHKVRQCFTYRSGRLQADNWLHPSTRGNTPSDDQL